MEADAGEALGPHAKQPGQEDVNFNGEKGSEPALIAEIVEPGEENVGEMQVGESEIENKEEDMEIDPPELTKEVDENPNLSEHVEGEKGDETVNDAKEMEITGSFESSNVLSEHEQSNLENVEKEKTLQKGGESPLQTRKRKAVDMRGQEDSGNEGPPAKEPVLESAQRIEEKDESSANESSSETKDMGLPPKQLLGKGKRARIPNKRYSDFPLTPAKHHEYDDHLKSLENGDTNKYPLTLDTETAPNLDETNLALNSPSVTALKGKATPTTSPATGKKRIQADLNDPMYLLPFETGWKRELVYRAGSDPNSKRQGDVYYYSPTGKKMRSMREIAENLRRTDLTMDNFCFIKEPIGLNDPQKEIVRDAKLKTAGSTSVRRFSRGPRTPRGAASPKTTPVEKEKIVEPVAAAAPAPEAPKAKNSPRGGGFKVKIPARAKGRVQRGVERKKTEEVENPYVQPYKTPARKTKSPATASLEMVSNKPCQRCSIGCLGVSIPIPTLQCRYCLCLYHRECVGLSPLYSSPDYVCKNCIMEQEPTTSTATISVAATVAQPPPLTPINALKSITTQPTALPKLQRIPRSSDDDDNLNSEQDTPEPANESPPLIPQPPILTKISKLSEDCSEKSEEISTPPVTNAAINTETKSIVGSVTTWFPSSSTIQVNDTQLPQSEQTQPNETEVFPPLPLRPQFVELIGNKKYLVIPKHHVLSVSPTIAATATTPTVRPNLETGHDPTRIVEENVSDPCFMPTPNPDSASLGPKVPLPIQIKVEPASPDHDPTSTVSSHLPATCPTDRTNTESTPAGNKAATRSKLDGLKSEHSGFMDNYLQNVAYGYNTLLYVFQYLKVQDLLSASCVCTMWRDIASHPLLWRTVRMKNSQIHNFEGLADALEKHGTVHLDLRKMLLPSNGGDEIWGQFSGAIEKVTSLRKIELCRCPALVIEQLPVSNPKLEVINAVAIKCEKIDLSPLDRLKELQELRLKSTSGFTLSSDLSALSELKQLRHLSLTSIKELNKLNIEVISDLCNLESLDLGECTDFPSSFGSEILTKLNKLEKLRLEKGQGNCHTFEILAAVKDMPVLEQLELVNFDIKSGFDKALGACTNIKKLLIIPTYISQSATTNHMVLGGVLRLHATLSHFVWGVTLELLRVTELFVDQCEDAEKKDKNQKRVPGTNESIPVLKPVPLLINGKGNVEIPPAKEPPQVEILPLPNLQKLLLQSLPTTRVKILKIPFHATWRQTVTDV